MVVEDDISLFVSFSLLPLYTHISLYGSVASESNLCKINQPAMCIEDYFCEVIKHKMIIHFQH